MAKLTKHLCDFCGGALGKSNATLTVPRPSQAKKKMKAGSLADMLGMPTLAVDSARQLDMCLGCAEGLIKWRHKEIERLVEDGYVVEAS